MDPRFCWSWSASSGTGCSNSVSLLLDVRVILALGDVRFFVYLPRALRLDSEEVEYSEDNDLALSFLLRDLLRSRPICRDDSEQLEESLEAEYSEEDELA
mmetsp:Transcript_61720/g.139063  ORF Transcript_61720/g.139063 Transcript_61720/m.139063 type:complete len:100 (+) Transcript_61720:349-648(+)|eukprot:CAMPEP_0197941918 /NCGR_PEP_ID=MMETSP1439-20131203/123560_1 /TAXON_ID=66791 /ORGANISM="Gonyaulax spinifera, Strain CCMP409" /LENGTH=99 /DNA_ID=CAMNT_0043565145 /DNA_START=287 /DNA_END=586 /DNA_ORIENTATION=+